MAVDVKVPSVGESVQEGMIHKWHKNSGDYVDRDEVIVELETDKATVEVVAEAAGVVKTLKDEGDTVNVGDVIASIDTDAAKPASGVAAKSEAPIEQKASPEPKAVPTPAPVPASTTTPSAPVHGGNAHLSPAVARMVAEHGLDTGSIAASGKGGRITKGDVVAHMEGGGTASLAVAQQPRLREVAQPAPTPPQVKGDRTERRENMSMLRRRIAERLVEAQQTAAILTTFNEVDLSAVMALRKQYKDAFQEHHGVGLGFMSFFVKASISALQAFPAINGWIEGKEIVYHDYYDIGVAVSSPRGLVVPVVRDADKLSMAGVEKAIAAYATKARDGKITVDDITGGTFTVSNGGVFGSLLSTPILNPPQSAILGMHKIEQRAVVVDGQIVARPMMYLALSYDHRIVDGKEAVQFLVKIKENVEDPQRLLLGV